MLPEGLPVQNLMPAQDSAGAKAPKIAGDEFGIIILQTAVPKPWLPPSSTQFMESEL